MPRASTSAAEATATRALSALELGRVACALSAWRGAPGRCQWCDGEIPPGRRRTWCDAACGRAWQRNHVWRFARSAARRRARYRCERPGCDAERRDCEVNHRTPRDGAGYGVGCHHHLAPGADGAGGLEVLCRAHHAEVTAAQARARAEARRAAAALADDVPPEVSP